MDENDEDFQHSLHATSSVSLTSDLMSNYDDDAEESQSADHQLGDFDCTGAASSSLSLLSDVNQSSTKQVYFEADSGNGQAYVLTLHDSGETYQATPVTLNESQSEEISIEQNEDVSDVSQAWFTSREEKSNLQSKGRIWKQGMWSKDEVELLVCNITKYCVENHIVDPSSVIFKMSKDERKDFYRIIAKGLNRPLFSVYRRVIRMYDKKNHIGKYTAEEMKKLRELRINYGNNWQAIGCEMGRSASSIKDKCRLMKDNCNTGKWFPCEEDRLAEAVYELSGAVPGETVTSGISWASVAERVATRSEKQCRTKWLNYLNWKQVGGSEWTRDDDVLLVNKICSLNVTDENEVNWIKMAERWESVRSPQWLRGKWWSLKRHIPNNQILGFKEICAQLYEQHISNVRVKGCGGSSAVNVSQQSELLSSEVIGQTIVSTSGITTMTVPHLGLSQAPSIVHVPIQVKPNGQLVAGSTVIKNNQQLHTFGLIQPGLHLTTTANPLFIGAADATSTPIPIATCHPTSTGQIIIQTVTAESLHDANLTMQMNVQPHIIINADPNGSNVATFSSANLSGTIQLTNTLEHKDVLECYMTDTTGLQMLDKSIEINSFESQDSDDDIGDLDSSNCPSTSPINGHLELEPDEGTMSSHLLSDPLLHGDDVNNSPEAMTPTCEHSEKNQVNDDSMDGVMDDDGV